MAASVLPGLLVFLSSGERRAVTHPHRPRGVFVLWCRPTHSRLAIEDPFETWYDVAHPVKKQSRYEWIRAELMRAYSIMVDRAEQPQRGFGTILDEICAEAPPPPFLRATEKQAAERQADAAAASEAQAAAPASATNPFFDGSPLNGSPLNGSPLNGSPFAPLAGGLPGGLPGGLSGLPLVGGAEDGEEVAGQQLEMILSGLAI